MIALHKEWCFWQRYHALSYMSTWFGCTVYLGAPPDHLPFLGGPSGFPLLLGSHWFLQTDSKCSAWYRVTHFPSPGLFLCLLTSSATSSLKHFSLRHFSNFCFIYLREEKHLSTLIHAANFCQGPLHVLSTQELNLGDSVVQVMGKKHWWCVCIGEQVHCASGSGIRYHEQ